MNDWRDFHGPNAGYVLELYDRFRQNPESVDAATRAYLATWSPPAETAALAAPEYPLEKIVGAVNLAQAIRAYGHLAARLDPLGSSPRGDPILLPSTHGVTEDDLRQLPASLICGPVVECAANALEAIQVLRAVYSSTTAYGYSHILVPEERDWLRHAAESGCFRSPQNPISPVGIAAAVDMYGGTNTTILNCTIVSNTAGMVSHSGIYLEASAGPLTIGNSIIAHNGVTNNVAISGTSTSLGYNLTNSGAGTPFTATGDLINTNPLIGPLQDNGGASWTHALLPGSPATNQIPNGTNGCGTTIATDQRGWPRPFPPGGKCDVGTFEAVFKIYLPVVIRSP
jgi:hypothetical protein